MSQDAPSRSLDKFIVRLPDGMRDMLAGYAKQNGRSLNSEIVARLQASLPPLVSPSDLEGVAAEIEATHRSIYEAQQRLAHLQAVALDQIKRAIAEAHPKPKKP